MSVARAKKIKVLLFDVDGVLTDGGIWLFPAPAGAVEGTRSARQEKADAGGYGIAGESIIEAKGFHAHDGAGISLARLGGLKLGIITKRISETVALRARDLKLDYVYQGQSNKVAAFRKILESARVREDEVAFVGDDIVDLPVMRLCGLALAVADAREEVKRESHWVTPTKGGRGAARDAIEYILKAQGKLVQAVEAYLSDRPDRTGAAGQ